MIQAQGTSCGHTAADRVEIFILSGQPAAELLELKTQGVLQNRLRGLGWGPGQKGDGGSTCSSSTDSSYSRSWLYSFYGLNVPLPDSEILAHHDGFVGGAFGR